MKPLLKADSELQASDFESYPIWINVHGDDESEDWYAECDETTFRPWEESQRPPEDRLLLVSTDMTFSNGRGYPGACYASTLGSLDSSSGGELHDSAVVRASQPRIFLADRTIPFWGGIAGVSNADRTMLYDAVGGPSEVFPITFDARSKLLPQAPAGLIRGFYRLISILSGESAVEVGLEPSSLTQPSNLPPTDYESVTALIGQDDYLAALERVEELIANSPNDADWWRLRSWALHGLGDLSNALESAKKVVELTPGKDGPYVGVGKLLLEIQDYGECLRYCDEGLAIKVDDCSMVIVNYSNVLEFFAARSLYELGRPQEAIQRLQSVERDFALGRNPDALMTRSGLLKICRQAMTESK